jgi:hypothetical protein
MRGVQLDPLAMSPSRANLKAASLLTRRSLLLLVALLSLMTVISNYGSLRLTDDAQPPAALQPCSPWATSAQTIVCLASQYHGTHLCAGPRQEQALRELIDACAKRQDTVTYLDGEGKVVVQQAFNVSDPCPLVDVFARGPERSVGMCTDIAVLQVRRNIWHP